MTRIDFMDLAEETSEQPCVHFDDHPRQSEMVREAVGLANSDLGKTTRVDHVNETKTNAYKRGRKDENTRRRGRTRVAEST